MRDRIKLTSIRTSLVLAVTVASLVLSVPPGEGPITARASSSSQSSSGCNWSASTWFSSYTVGWGLTNGDSACATDSAIEFSWYDGSTWRYTGWLNSGTYWIQRGASPAYSLTGKHWIEVGVNGWGQRVDTSE